jgi:antitoxin ParD1/3/4
MDVVNISLPDNLKDYVVTQISEGGYDSVTDYVIALIHADQRQKAKAVVEAEVLRGMLDDAGPMTGNDWDQLRARAAGARAEK